MPPTSVPKPLPPKPAPTALKLPPKPTGVAPRTAKTFAVSVWDGKGEGQKIILYGPNGHGKTTLAAMAPNPVFIGLDDGGRQTRNPKTGEEIPISARRVVTFRPGQKLKARVEAYVGTEQ